ncbi:MAG: hypothetical protein KGH98_03510 [Candidatus Micrarchaeota archaeon]|nr:hypothetical protein [Candidatus Micrarchaeota archaeon]
MDRRYWFYQNMALCIEHYALSGDTRPIRGLGFRAPGLSELCMCISDSLDTGRWLYRPLKLLRKRQDSIYALRAKSLGGIAGALSLTRLGSTIFFPAFAGISLDILSFGPGMVGGGKALGVGAISMVLISYILIINYVNSAFTPGRRPLRKAGEMAAFSSIAGLVFSASSYLGNFMLR